MDTPETPVILVSQDTRRRQTRMDTQETPVILVSQDTRRRQRRMDTPETLVLLVSQDTRRRQTQRKQKQHNTENQDDGQHRSHQKPEVNPVYREG